MSRKGRTARTAGRPSSQARLVYDDVVYGEWVRGWQTDGGEFSFITFVRVRTGSILCTLNLIQEWWSQVPPEKKEQQKVSYVQKALSSRNGTGSGQCAHDSGLATRCPALHEFLTLCELPGGKRRVTSSLSLFTEGSLWKAVLNDRDTGLCLFVTEETLEALWEALEQRLTADQVEWRVNKYASPQNASQGVDKRNRRQ